MEAYADKCINDIPNDVKSSPFTHKIPYIQNQMSGDNGYSNHEKPNIEEYLTKLEGNNANK